jgi:cyanophycinase
MNSPKGILIPIGGNEDKGIEKNEMYTLEFIKEGILSYVVEEAGGKNAKMVIIPTASSIPDEVMDNYNTAFTKLGCTNIHMLDIREREDSETPHAIELIKTAKCVMMSGGDQSKITDKIGNTEIHRILLDRYQNEEGFVIAGTSAGAMVMSKEMISGGSATEALMKGAVNMYKGLGLIPELIIDTHFVKRGRFGRQTEAVAMFPKLIGIGLSEDTAMIIRNGEDCTVIGSGMVIIFDGSQITQNNHHILKSDTPLTITDLKIHILSNGDQYNFKTKGIRVLPIGSKHL